ncbi:MAG: hypothetical protein ACOCP4_05560 [Candidatus Woesearchaeota archaeon]
MKINDIITETSSSGATSAATVASVSNPIKKMQKRNPDGTAVNALDQDDIFASGEDKSRGVYANSIKRKNK